LGITKNEYKHLFAQNTLPCGIDEVVSFKGRLSHVETITSISKADYHIFIRNSNKLNMAGFPTKYVESISCGTPVLTNSMLNIEKYFIPGQTGYILDTSSQENLKKSLFKACNVGKDKIINMKKYCKDFKGFNYSNYIDYVDSFMKNI
ncbi:MAG: glycosyltransferase, partial [Desulfatiglans sp.]|nr:glycosyltransferase [Desulfatiglans sp.]